MKTSTLLSAGLFLLVASCAATGSAADPLFNSGSVPNRGLFGLPMPQQWSGARPVGLNTGYNGSNYRTTGYSSNCPSGNCPTGYRGQTTNYAPGQYASGNCVNGQCATGNCPNGQCSAGNCVNGQCATGNCPNGNCGVAPYTSNRLPVGAASGWAPRTSRTGAADPFRRSGEVADRDVWTQRGQRSLVAPLDDALNSRYRSEDLNLRNEYFSNERGADYDGRSQSLNQSRLNSNEWNRPSRRSMEAPVNSKGAVARF